MDQDERILNNIALAYYMAGKFKRKCPWVELEDLQGECLLRLTAAAHKYDPTMGPFEAYACAAMVNTCIDFCRNERNRGLHVPATARTTTRVAAFSSMDVEPDPAQKDLEDSLEIPRGFWERVSLWLTPHEQQALVGIYRDGKTQGEVALEQGRTHQTVSQRLLSAIDRLRDQRDEILLWLERHNAF